MEEKAGLEVGLSVLHFDKNGKNKGDVNAERRKERIKKLLSNLQAMNEVIKTLKERKGIRR